LQDIDEEERLVNNSFKVDIITEFANTQEELILHWGISKRNAGEWNSPDDRYLPDDTLRFRDGKACQTKFLRDHSTTSGGAKAIGNLRSVHINFWWKEAMEPAVKSMSFVLMEQGKNLWHNNGGRDYIIKFESSQTQQQTPATLGGIAS
jgi:hypothetical protein